MSATSATTQRSRPIKKALVLGGGTIKGAFQAGAAAEVLKSFRPDAIYGVSVGALNGAFLTEQAGQRFKQEREGERDWRVLWPEIGTELVDFWKSNIRSPRDIGIPVHVVSIMWRLWRGTHEGFITPTTLEALIGNNLQGGGILELARYPGELEFEAGAVNLISGAYHRIELDHPQLLKYIMASCAIPIVFPVVKIGDERFVDGGLRDVAPLKSALEAGADEVVCVMCQPKDLGAAEIRFTHILDLIDRSLDIVVNENLNRSLRELDTSKVRVHLIRPRAHLDAGLSSFDATTIESMITQGAAEARRIMSHTKRPSESPLADPPANGR